MDVICTIAQILILVVVAALFLAALVVVLTSLARMAADPRTVSRRSRGEIERIFSEGRKSMDDLSEQYLDELFRQVTAETSFTQDTKTQTRR